MNKASLLFLTYAVCSFTISYSQEKLEVGGAIIIMDSKDPIPASGTIRFNPITNDFEGWNGLQWISLTGFQYEIGEMTDQDGNTYPTVIIGGQEWTAKNLRTTTFDNGNAIPLIGNNTKEVEDWSEANYGAYSVYDTMGSGYLSFDVNEFGFLYNWFAVNDGRGLCPADWHVPTDLEWTTLIDYLDPGIVNPSSSGTQSSVAGGPMKEVGSLHWNIQNTGANNSSGFTGLPSGFRSTNGSFHNLAYYGHWWSSTEAGANAWDRDLGYNSDNVSRVALDKRSGFSVRCIRD